MNKKSITIITAAVILIGAGAYFYFARNSDNQETSRCLREQEVVEYTLDSKTVPELKIPSVPTVISIKDKAIGKTLWSFRVEDFLPLLRIQKCGIYVAREFNPGAKNYKTELWRYDYSGNGEKILDLATFVGGKSQGVKYATGFAIDDEEKYLVLERGYLGKPDFGVVIKDLKSMKDVYALTLDEVIKLDSKVMPGIISTGIQLGGLDVGRWTSDGRYHWGTIFDGALDTAYYRVEMGTWKTEVFPRPGDMPAGNEHGVSFSAYLAYADFPTFFGIDVIEQQAQERFKQQGRKKHLYLYNLRTKQKELLAEVADPAWKFKPKWLSDTELEYYAPSGERKTRTVVLPQN